MPNLWQKFRSILPADPLIIGTVTSTDAATGTVRAQLPSGDILTVRGTASVEDVVFIRAGQIQGIVNGLTAIADLEV